jgi:membrane-anchored mycosin MYCP
MRGAAIRVFAATVVVLLTGMMSNAPTAMAIEQPSVDPALVPSDGAPGPEQPMRQSNVCARAIAVPSPGISRPAPGFAMLNVDKAWQYSTGNGVAVAVIDTGVNPSPRLPVVPGGDYITAGDGLSDCDAHGTIVASLISAAPKGAPMPPPMPPKPAFVLPPVVPPAAAGLRPSDGPEAPHEPSSPEPNSASRTEPQGPGSSLPPVDAPDGVAGVAPHATVISIRQSSRAFEPEAPGPGDLETRRKAGTVTTLARAIVHAADLGSKVINVSVTACVSAADPLDQRALGAAVWYAATVKDAVIVAAAGNEGEDGCAQNSAFDPLDTGDARAWKQVKTVSSPSWFTDYVLSVGAVDITGAPLSKSLAGPWVGTAAPGVGIIGLSPQTGSPVNAYPPIRPGEKDIPFWGTSFSAAYVSGVAALVRAKYPQLTAHQVITRILQTSHNPPRGVDNQVGYGVVDPVAALTFDVPLGGRQASGAQTRVVTPPSAPPPPDHRARTFAMAFAAAVAAGAVLLAAVRRARRSR